MKKQIICAILAISLLFAFAGCSGKPASQENTPSQTPSREETTTPAAQAVPEKVKFSLWHSYVGTDQRAPFMEARMSQFREQYPNYEIDEQKIPRDQYQTKLKTQAAAGQLPDAFVVWPNAMTIEFATSNLLADINDLLERNPEWRDGFVSRALDEFTVDGKTYSAGLGVSVTSIVFYNKALFDKYNLSYPQSYEELKNVITTFVKNGVIPIAHGNKPKWPAQSTIFSLMANRETGSEWLDNVLAKNGAQFTDPEFIRALEKFEEITKLGAFNKDFISLDNVQMRDYFYKGQAAMMIDGSWAVPDVIAKAPEDLKANIELDILPGFEGGKGDPNVMSGVSATGIAINKKVSPQQKAAIEDLIVFLTNSEAQQMYAEYNIPVSYKNVTIDKSKADPIYIKLTELISKHPLVTVYDSALNSELTEIVNNGIQGIMVGKQTPEEVAKQLQAAVK